MRFSLREFLIVTTIAALGVPAFCFANPIIKGLALLAIGLCLLRAAILVLIERGERQTAALGFLVPAGLYATIVFGPLAMGTKSYAMPEFDPYKGQLPTTTVLLEPLESVWNRRVGWVDPNGNPSPTPPPPGAQMGGSGLGGFGGSGGWRRIERPYRYDAMPVAHCLWTLLFGYLGGKYALHVYTRRVKREQEAAAANPREP